MKTQKIDTVDYSRKWLAMIAVAMGVFLSTIDGSIVNIALPTLVRELNTEFAVVQWVVLAYLLTVTTLMLSIGRLADMLGKKPLYTIGFVIFTIGSVLCGMSPTVYWLIGFRVLQGVGAAMVMALGMAIVTEAFPPQERGRALGIMGSVVSVGIVVGPTLGGVLIDWLSWQSIFYVNLPVGIIGTFMVIKFVPFTQPGGHEQFDYWGALVMFISVLSLLLALTLGQQTGFNRPQTWILLGIWLTGLISFIIIERHVAYPMINLNLFKNELFSVNLSTGFTTFIAVAGTTFLLPFYLENVLGYAPRQVGLFLAVIPLALGVVAPLSGALSDKFGTRPISVLGLMVLVCGYYAISTLDQNTTVLGYVVRLLPMGVGMGLFQSPNNSAVMGAVAKNRLGIASGLLAISRTLGQTTGISVMGALWAGRVKHYAGNIIVQDVTQAPVMTQVSALQDTFISLVILISLALCLGIWALLYERNKRQRVSVPIAPSQQQ